jgi:hypothetical protein
MIRFRKIVWPDVTRDALPGHLTAVQEIIATILANPAPHKGKITIPPGLCAKGQMIEVCSK